MNCPKCGQNNDEGAKFCGRCGSPLSPLQEQTGESVSAADKVPQKKKFPVVKVLVVVLVCFLALDLVGGIWYFCSRNGGGGNSGILISALTMSSDMVPAGETDSILFTASVDFAGGKEKKVLLRCDSPEFSAEMNDSGENGDETAGDGIYSVTADVSADDIEYRNYYVSVGKAVSEESAELVFVRDLTDEEINSFCDFSQQVSGLGYDDAKSLVSSSSDVLSYEIDEETHTISFTTRWYITGVWMEFSDSSYGSGELAVPTESGVDYAAAEEAIGQGIFYANQSECKVAVVRPFQWQFNSDESLQAGRLLTTALNGEGEPAVADDGDAGYSFFESLGDYDVILVESHGIFRQGKPYIVTGESFEQFQSDYTDRSLLSEDLVTRRVVSAIGEAVEGHAAVDGEWFTHHYENGALDGSTWFLTCCSGLKSNKLAKALTDLGAEVVIGFTDVAYTNYVRPCLFETIINSMLLSGDTAADAVANAKAVYGESDSSAAEAGYQTTLDMYGNGDWKLTRASKGIMSQIDLLESLFSSTWGLTDNVNLEYGFYNFYYVTDLDRDGYLEITTRNLSMFGSSSYTSMWEVNEDITGLTQLPTDSFEPVGFVTPGGIDPYTGWYDIDSGLCYYIVSSTRIDGWAEVGTNYYSLCLDQTSFDWNLLGYTFSTGYGPDSWYIGDLEVSSADELYSGLQAVFENMQPFRYNIKGFSSYDLDDKSLREWLLQSTGGYLLRSDLSE